jgi:geranylgeranyl diphosphate synthase type II
LPPRDAAEILRRHAEDITSFLHALPARLCPDAPPRLSESIAYSLLAGGKRLRPALVMESFAACGGAPGRRDAALAAAAATELVHTFSLVHDDLPAMDDDDLRRGRPTNHKVYGEAMAILAGDAMTSLAFEVLATVMPAEVGLRLDAELSHAAGPAGMIGGQVLDMEGEQQSLPLEQLQRLHRMKTGALLTASCRMGAIAAGADVASLDALTQFGRHVGLAFQIVDDVLDVTSTPEQLGKATGKDKGKGKNTYPGLLGLEGSRAEAKRQLEAARSALGAFGTSAEGLRSLAAFIVERQI